MLSAPQSFATFVGAEPAWEIAMLFPAQGTWTVDEYLDLTDSTRRLVEFTDGRIEVLEMPTVMHQRMLLHLLLLFKQFVDEKKLGEVLCAALRVQVSEAKFREPDIVFLHKDHDANIGNRYWAGADLVVEIVSEDPASRDRDLVKKRIDYAAAGIREYWIVDHEKERITVLVLDGERYAVHGEHAPGEKAASRLLEGFAVDVADVFKAAER